MLSELPKERSRDDTFNVAMETVGTSPGSTEHSDDDDGDILIMTMAIVAGTVALIVAIIVVCFIIKSRRRRQENIRIYEERRQRPLTVSLEVNDDRGERSPEVGNGVNSLQVENSLYIADDTIIPIAVYRSQSDQDRSSQPSQQHRSVNLPENSESVTNERESRERVNFKKSSSIRRTDTLTSSASEKEISTFQAATNVYENTKASNGMYLYANDKKKQQSMPNLNDDSNSSFVGIGRRHNSQKHSRSGKVDGDYETAFPLYDGKKSGNDSRNVANLDAEIKSVENNDKSRKADSAYEVDLESRAVRDNSTEDSYSMVKKLKPEVKPKPRKLNDKVNTDINSEQDTPFRHSSANVKRDKFKQAKFLKAVPPPCNKVTYVNVPDNSSQDSAPGNFQHDDHVTTSDKEASSTVCNEKIDIGAVDYVNIREKKCTNLTSSEVNGDRIEQVNISGKMNSVSNEQMGGQYVNVPKKKSSYTGSAHTIEDESKEYVNVPDKKSCNYNIDGEQDHEIKDYVNVPDKKSITSVTKEEFNGKGKAKNNVPEHEFKRSDDGKTEIEDSSYVNIPENLSINVTPSDLRRPLSDYEDPGCIISLKKDPKSKHEVKVKGKHRHTHQVQLKHSKNVLKPDDNNSGVPVRGRSVSESPTIHDLDYENKDAAIELQRKFRRGLSTSSVETGGRYDWKTGQRKVTKSQNTSGEEKMSDDDTYLEMDTLQTEEDIYLHMDSPDNNPYVDMTSPEEDETYMRMIGNSSKSVASKSRTLQPKRSGDIGFAFRTCPKPCGGASGVYNNFSENPPHYANCFRSKSTSNLNEYSYADTKPVVKLI